MPINTGGQHGGHAGHLVNSTGIMEVTVGCRLKQKGCRIAADGSGRKRADLGHQRWEGSRDGPRTCANPRRRQETTRREVKGADTRARL